MNLDPPICASNVARDYRCTPLHQPLVEMGSQELLFRLASNHEPFDLYSWDYSCELMLLAWLWFRWVSSGILHFNLLFPDVEHLFIYLFAISVFSLEECLFRFFAHFLNQVVSFIVFFWDRDQVGLKLVILLPQPQKYWDYKHVLLCLAFMLLSSRNSLHFLGSSTLSHVCFANLILFTTYFYK
jgi:hypothetical protein